MFPAVCQCVCSVFPVPCCSSVFPRSTMARNTARRREGPRKLVTEGYKRAWTGRGREGPGGKKLMAPRMPALLLIQLMGILHLSALCARAVAVASAVLSPAASTTTATVVASSVGKSLVAGVVGTRETKERALVPAAPVGRAVSGASHCAKRPRQEERGRTRPPDSVLPVVRV